MTESALGLHAESNDPAATERRILENRVANLNKVMLIGRLTRDPELKTFQNGGAVVHLGFACNNRRKNQQTGEWEDEPVFIDCKAFNRGENGTLATRMAETLRKGQQVFIEGHLTLEQWEDKQSGAKRQQLKVIIDNFQYLEPKRDGGGENRNTGRSGSSVPTDDDLPF